MDPQPAGSRRVIKFFGLPRKNSVEPSSSKENAPIKPVEKPEIAEQLSSPKKWVSVMKSQTPEFNLEITDDEDLDGTEDPERTVSADAASFHVPISLAEGRAKRSLEKSDPVIDYSRSHYSTTSETAKCILDHDLSNGLELHPVRLWNDTGVSVKIPDRFEYICHLERMASYKLNPCVCQCIDEECSVRCHCIVQAYGRTTKEDGKIIYESAYEEKTGLLLTPTKWAVPIIPDTPRSIWECSAGCPCGPGCFNRCVQFGPRYKFEVFYTGRPEIGWGVRAKSDMPGGTFIAEYCGQLKIEPEEGFVNSGETKYHFTLHSSRETSKKKNRKTPEKAGKTYYIDATTKGNFTRFINHSCFPNSVAINVFYDDNDLDKGMHTGIFLMRKISRNTEITLNYGENYWIAEAENGRYCQCGSTACNSKDLRPA